MIMYNTNPSMNRMLLVIAFSKAMLHESTGIFKFDLLLSSSSSFSTDIDNSCSTLELFFCNFSYKCNENDLMVTPAAYNSILFQISVFTKGGVKIITFRLDSNVTEFERNVS